MPEPLATHLRAAGIGGVQFALVDCPGHATLIRTIIGGAQIIDLMVLVVDVTKGIQTQTAEVLCSPLDIGVQKLADQRAVPCGW